MVPRCLTIAGSDSGGGAGIQADLKAFASLGCHGMSVVVALTAQNTVGVTGITEASPEFVRAELEAVFSDIGVDAVKTGMLFSEAIVTTVAEFLGGQEQPVQLVVDPVFAAASGAQLIQGAAVGALVGNVFPLATVVTPNLREACTLAGVPYSDDADRRELSERIFDLGPAAVVVTGGHGSEAVDWLFDGDRHVPIPVQRYSTTATHGAGCTHSASLTALLAKGNPLEAAARGAAEVASRAVRDGLVHLGSGEGPVDVFGLAAQGTR
ncbi:MAG: bifunctional hydroxymethylpyrimidine kinase/phosphomethylpyrimidine kinase [Actinomycetia bacterium]|nr:bifunctional hydroxymethylpyrimidine kinase/phosphomethylpyrimidine kinase [Actinomycetes bacterium]